MSENMLDQEVREQESHQPQPKPKPWNNLPWKKIGLIVGLVILALVVAFYVRHRVQSARQHYFYSVSSSRGDTYAQLRKEMKKALSEASSPEEKEIISRIYSNMFRQLDQNQRYHDDDDYDDDDFDDDNRSFDQNFDRKLKSVMLKVFDRVDDGLQQAFKASPSTKNLKVNGQKWSAMSDSQRDQVRHDVEHMFDDNSFDDDSQFDRAIENRVQNMILNILDSLDESLDRNKN